MKNDELYDLYEENCRKARKRKLTVYPEPYEVRLTIVNFCNRSCPFCAVPTERKGVSHTTGHKLGLNEFKKVWLPSIPLSVKKLEISILEGLWNENAPDMIALLREKLPLAQISAVTNTDPLKYYGIDYLNECFQSGLNYLQMDIYDKKTLHWVNETIIPYYKEDYKGVDILPYSQFKGCIQTYHSNKKKVIILLTTSFEKGAHGVTRNWRSMAGQASDEQWARYGTESKLAAPLKLNCTYPLKHMVIDFDGAVSPCCPDGNFSLPVGNIHDSNLSQIWRSRNIQALRYLLSLKRRDLIPTCSICDNRTFRDGLFPYWGERFTIVEAKKVIDSYAGISKLSQRQFQRYVEVNNITYP